MKVKAKNSLGETIEDATITVTLKLNEVEATLVKPFIPDIPLYVENDTISFGFQDFTATKIGKYTIEYTVAQVNPNNNDPNDSSTDLALPSSILYDAITGKFTVSQENELEIIVRVTGHLFYGQSKDISTSTTFKITVLN